MRAFIANARCSKGVDHRRACDRAAVAAEGVITLLVGSDQKDLAPHQSFPSRSDRKCCNALPAAPPMTSAMVDGSASTEEPTRLVPSPRACTSIVDVCSRNMGAVIRY